MSSENGLPKGWTGCTLGDVITIIRGVSYKKEQARKEPQDGYLPVLRANSIDQTLHFDDLVYVPESCVSDEQRLKVNDIVIAASSGSRHIVGKAAQLTTPWVGSFGAFCMGIRVKQDVAPQFVGYFLQSAEYRHQISRLAAGVNINNLRREHIESFPFRVAPFNEQRRIVAKIEELFSDLDAGVAALTRARANLKRYRAAVLKAAVEGRLTAEWRKAHPDVEPADQLLKRILAARRKKWEQDQLAKYEANGKQPPKNWKDKYKEPALLDTAHLPTLPASWCWATVEQLGGVQLGRQRSPKNRSNKFPTKYIRAANITETGLDVTDVLDMEFRPNEMELYRLRLGDILLSEASGSADQVGKPVVWKGEIDDCCFQNTVIRLRPDGMSSEYPLTVFRHYYMHKVFAKTSAGVGINHLSAAKFSALPFPLAPLAEQTTIADEVEQVLSTIAVSVRQIDANLLRAASLRQSILKRAFDGKLVPQDANDEPVSALVRRIQEQHQRDSIVPHVCRRRAQHSPK